MNNPWYGRVNGQPAPAQQQTPAMQPQGNLLEMEMQSQKVLMQMPIMLDAQILYQRTV